MNFQDLFDVITGVRIVREAVQRAHPAENVILATSATLYQNKKAASPLGISLCRLGQRRGVIVVTTKRIIFKSPAFSLLNLGYASVLASSLISGILHPRLTVGCICLGFLILLIQRRPYAVNIPFNEIQSIEFHTVRGIVAFASLLRLITPNGVLDIVASDILTSDAHGYIVTGCRANRFREKPIDVSENRDCTF